MAVKFLSPEWLSEVTTALENHQGFQDAARGMELGIQFDVLGAPIGDTGYHLVITPQAITIALGVRDDLDITISQNYETAAAIMRGDLNVQSAFITGKNQGVRQSGQADGPSQRGRAMAGGGRRHRSRLLAAGRYLRKPHLCVGFRQTPFRSRHRVLSPVRPPTHRSAVGRTRSVRGPTRSPIFRPGTQRERMSTSLRAPRMIRRR